MIGDETVSSLLPGCHRAARQNDALANEQSVRWAVILACLPVLQVWGNILLHQAFGYDWLGTRPYIVDPTFIAGFGRLVIGLEHWVAIFAALMPLLALLGLVITPGLAQLLSKLTLTMLAAFMVYFFISSLFVR